MIILGVAFLSDASACILRDGKIVAAVSEERLNRKKLWHGVPRLAIAEALRIAGLTIDDVDVIATHGDAPRTPDRAPFDRKEAAIVASKLDPETRKRQIQALRSRQAHEAGVLGTRTPAYLAEIRALGKPVETFGHHESHAATAFWGSGWEDCLVLTADGWGEDGSGGLWRGDAGGVHRLTRNETIDSLGYFYGSVTKALGFVPHRHEGKVLGLAAYCTEPKSMARIGAMVDVDTVNRRFVGRMENGLYMPRFENPALADYVKDFPREDVSSAVQRTLEDVVCRLVGSLGTEARRIAVAGGIFANVKLNQRLAELPDVESVYVFPNMGDGGLSVGAAWLCHFHRTNVRPAPIETMYLGAGPTDAEIGAYLAKAGLPYRRSTGIHDEIAALLAKGEVVARCHGRMEFGPRALGHRSILCEATRPEINDWLNKRLKRSEFMPFAPATLAEAAHEHYIGLDKGTLSSAYMTMTFDCTPKMRAESPAAVHVDGTARPQVLDPVRNADFHGIVSAYRARTGLASVINTSFNMHEEPIINGVDDAVRGFVASGLPYLAVGDFLVESGKA